MSKFFQEPGMGKDFSFSKSKSLKDKIGAFTKILKNILNFYVGKQKHKQSQKR